MDRSDFQDYSSHFFAALAGGKRTGALMQVPGAIHWLMHNQTVIPGRSHELIDEVGLLGVQIIIERPVDPLQILADQGEQILQR